MRAVAVLLVGICASALSGCGHFSSYTYGLEGPPSGSGNLYQSYFLPKTILSVTVSENGSDKNILLVKETVPVRDVHFKVHYNRSILHHDDISVETTSAGFLSVVQAHSTDKTAEIVEQFAKILMTNIGGEQYTGSLRSLSKSALGGKTLLTVQFDPFDVGDFGYKNQLLRREGYCLAVFDRHDKLVPGSCNWRLAGAHRPPAASDALEISLPEDPSGFFFRKPVQHKIVVFRKTAKKVWRPIWAGWEAFENQADLLEIKLDRGSFIKRQAKLTFTAGNLTSHTLDKESEFLGFMAIPTIVVNTLVQIPGLEVGAQERANNLKERELAAREQESKLRMQELQLRSADAAQSGGPDGAVRSSGKNNGPQRSGLGNRTSFMTNCLDQVGMSTQACEAAYERERGGG